MVRLVKNVEKSKCTVKCELEVPGTSEYLVLRASLPTCEGFEELLGGFDSVRRGYFLGTTFRSDLSFVHVPRVTTDLKLFFI